MVRQTCSSASVSMSPQGFGGHPGRRVPNSGVVLLICSLAGAGRSQRPEGCFHLTSVEGGAIWPYQSTSGGWRRLLSLGRRGGGLLGRTSPRRDGEDNRGPHLACSSRKRCIGGSMMWTVAPRFAVHGHCLWLQIFTSMALFAIQPSEQAP